MSSAFFIWIEFGQSTVDASVAKSMMHALDGFGGDAQDLLLNDKLAIGSQTRWTTPEDVGEQQPLFNKSDTECFLFDGRIDNRQHLIDELAQQASINSHTELSDGALLYAFLSRFGDARLAEVIGPYVFVIFNLANGQLRCARDAMGGRYLAYLLSNERLIIASTELAFIRHPEVGHRLNEPKIASWLIGHHDGNAQSCLEGLRVLAPGHKLSWAQPQLQSQQKGDYGAPNETVFYQPNPERRVRYHSDQEYADKFRRLLDQAVSRRLRSRTHVACMLSGGMDSMPIAISAAKQSKPGSMFAYSWVFDESPEMDERAYSQPICQTFGIQQRLINCDNVWPKFDKDTHLNPLFPFALPYSEFQQETFRRASDDNVSVVLSGLQGDLLYETGNRQVIDSLKEQGLKAAIGEYRYLRNAHGLSHWSGIKRYLIAPLRWLQSSVERRRLSRPIANDWLSPSMLASLSQTTHYLFKTSLKAARPVQYRMVMDGFAGDDAALGRSMENKYGIERRYPFRDRELCEFLLAIPTRQLAHLSTKRPIVKRAYAAEFTAQLLQRNDKTDFAVGLRKGILADQKWQKFLAQTPSPSSKYVKDCNLSALDAVNTNELVVLWRCAYYNFWHQMWYDQPHNNDVGQ